jgi:ComF family protein
MIAAAAPRGCGVCAQPCGEEGPLCRRCRAALARVRSSVEPGPPGIGLCCAVGPYEGVLRRLVGAIKFGRRTALVEWASEPLARIYRERLGGELVAVPADPLRWRWRGFDPAEELALALAARTGRPLRTCLRRAAGRRQAGHSRRERLAEAPRVRAVSVVPDRAVLIDDVHTTGATLAACAGALRSAGCRKVDALTLARA